MTTTAPRTSMAIALAMILATIMALSIVQAAPAEASATKCAWSHGAGGSTCIGVNGSGLRVNSVRVSHGDGTSYGNFCNYKAKVWGTLKSGSAWSRTSALVSKCVPPPTTWIDFTLNLDFKHNSQFYGQFYHDGAWAPGAPAATIHS